MIRAGEFFEEDEDPAELEKAFEEGIPALSKVDVTELRWRVGTHYNIHVYAEDPSGDRERDHPVATFHTPQAAQHAVFAHNRLLRQFSDDKHSPEELAAYAEAWKEYTDRGE